MFGLLLAQQCSFSSFELVFFGNVIGYFSFSYSVFTNGVIFHLRKSVNIFFISLFIIV